MISQNTLKTKFDYHPDGYLVWKYNPNFTNPRNGKKAGSTDKRGRVRIMVEGKQYLSHRLIFLYHHGYLPELIDHIDYDHTNNRIDNLREATHSTNKMNRTMPSHNTSGYKCVTKYRGKRGGWIVQVVKEGKTHFAGPFDDVHEAGAKAKEMVEELHGEFARP